MTNYEKLISSIILSAVLSKTTYGLGCGCDCFDDDDDDITNNYYEPQIKTTEETYENQNKNKNNYYGSQIKTTEGINNSYQKPNEEIIIGENYDSDVIPSSFYKGYGLLISTIIKTRSKDSLLQLFTIESQIFNNINEDNENNILEKIEDIKNQNVQLIKKLYNIFQEEYKNKVDRNFSYDFYEENKDQIEKFDYIAQLTIVSFLINLINALSEENQTIEKFSETCLYHNLKEEHNKNITKEFIIQKKSPIKNIFQKLRDQLFLSLFNYTTSYLNLCYLKFGEGLWIKKDEKTISLSTFFKGKSDKQKTIKGLFASIEKMFSNYSLYKNVCDMPFSKITNIKEKFNSLPSFSDVFEKNEKNYKIKEGQIETFKGYFNFLEESNSNPLEHEKDINKFFAVLPKLDKVNEIQDEDFKNMSFTFKGLEAPEIKLTENIKEEEEE